jgi:hypothetical protein
MSGVFSPIGPSLRSQQRQIMHPVVLTYPAGINQMGQIVFRIRKYKVGVGDSIVPVNRSCLFRDGNVRCPLDRSDGRFASGEADKALIKEI